MSLRHGHLYKVTEPSLKLAPGRSQEAGCQRTRGDYLVGNKAQRGTTTGQGHTARRPRSGQLRPGWSGGEGGGPQTPGSRSRGDRSTRGRTPTPFATPVPRATSPS